MTEYKRLTADLSVAPQLHPQDMADLARAGFHTVINNRPEGEAEDQPDGQRLEQAAREAGMAYHALPVIPGQVEDADARRFGALLAGERGPVLAFCRTGTRSTCLWALSQSHRLDPAVLLETAAGAGYDLGNLEPRLQAHWRAGPDNATRPHSPASDWDVLVVGGGAGGLAAAASLLKRRPSLTVAVVEPTDTHYYQPAWTLVGGGAFDPRDTAKPMARVMPRGAKWLRARVAAFEPAQNRVVLEDGERIGYRALVVAPGLELNLDAVEGLRDSLGRNGVTTNYLFETAPYTWEQVRALRAGRALFTQPPMPIKCAGAPQKAMYLSCHHWEKEGRLKDVDVQFHNAGAVLFGVEAFVPPLMEYVRRYGVSLNFQSNLRAVDGEARKAWFVDTDADGNTREREESFDLLHVTPPQRAPGFVRDSPLANDAGWVDADAHTLRHPRFENVFTLGDASGTANAKTAAAVRKQAPVLATNLIASLEGRSPSARYQGYGACPLTVERGKVVLAEFGYNGALQPTFPLAPEKARSAYWWLKAKGMPRIYFDLMLKGREWLTD
ncbi:bifunctional protein tyrosine phosphatase family protein/NAD(P)/FAD-dependent oxidoreductase [Alloalcanivorax profundimaris]|uniref:bifunctional protein tyrosine phosphatase family protein/NAD(P)/FAD-dependent oxidoreductase n=1 Tax=Alloalcanivorax profundimaris TaxID=2735259 RepID=UPI001888116F|nr:bifunctional protein tyrosine phosphatase family protein/NAD(P)/FAD-dependent oxidoreductase [Alloalcanivorax profundimaris]MBF1800278.1 TIGR01244 family phosphatase [Alloalcanivorax profundimaris]